MKTIKDRILETNGRIFSCTFRKKDGTLREMRARLGVEKYLQGGKLSYDVTKTPNVIVFDLDKMDYRTINTDAVQSFKCGADAYHAGLDLERMTKDFFNWSDRKQAE